VRAVSDEDVIRGGELRTRAEGIVADLGRITQAWRAGRAPSQAELYALADDVDALRSDLPRATSPSPVAADRLLS
jgi:hypothetical protein